jgi:DNA polymerase-3 subunit alpha
VIRDVGRALAMSYGEVDYIAKMIHGNKTTLTEALSLEPELKRLVETDANVKRLWDLHLN